MNVVPQQLKSEDFKKIIRQFLVSVTSRTIAVLGVLQTVDTYIMMKILWHFKQSNCLHTISNL